MAAVLPGSFPKRTEREGGKKKRKREKQGGTKSPVLPTRHSLNFPKQIRPSVIPLELNGLSTWCKSWQSVCVMVRGRGQAGERRRHKGALFSPPGLHRLMCQDLTFVLRAHRSVTVASVQPGRLAHTITAHLEYNVCLRFLNRILLFVEALE